MDGLNVKGRHDMYTFGRIAAYAKILFSSFFNWWWAAITGFASIASFLSLPQDGVLVSRLLFSVLLLVALLLIFLTLTTAYQGWLLFDRRAGVARLTGVCANADYGGLAFLLASPLPIPNGTVLEMRRYDRGVESLAGVLEVVESSVDGVLQARAVWASPGHLRDIRSSRVHLTDIIISTAISSRTLSRLKDENLGADES